MERKLWKLQQISERMWNLSTMMALEAAGLAEDGRGMAIVAEETRILTKRLCALIERNMFDNEEIDSSSAVHHILADIQFLAINGAIESCRLYEKGKRSAVCADAICTLADEIADILDAKKQGKIFGGTRNHYWPKTPLTSSKERTSMLVFNVAGVDVVENMRFVLEVVTLAVLLNSDKTKLTLRGTEINIIDCGKQFGKPSQNPSYVILHTPWAAKDELYAIATDGIAGIIMTPHGTPVAAASSTPPVNSVRECWENENDDNAPFYFMDWPTLHKNN